jgi:hypothetical protein
MKALPLRLVQTRCIEQLGLDSTALDLSSPEALAAVLRRLASFLCPCPSTKLVKAALALLEPLVDMDSLRDSISNTLDDLTGYGDLIESGDISGQSSGRMIYLAAPSFVEASANMILLFGNGPDGSYPLPSDLVPRVEPVTHYRRLRVENLSEVRSALLKAGFIASETDAWLKEPPISTSQSLVSSYDVLLSKDRPVGTLEGVTVLETERPVTYYRGRWGPLKRQTGRFVARRPQEYGADLWCYMELAQGVVQCFIDFPILTTHWRACDEAWHLQQAIDAVSQHPQVYKIRSGPSKGTVAVDFFSPIPGWAQRTLRPHGSSRAPKAFA